MLPQPQRVWIMTLWVRGEFRMQLHGLQSTPVKRPNLLQRILGKAPKDNAFIEITNLFAENRITSVSMPTVAEILGRHDLGFADCHDAFLDLFHRVLLHLGNDHALSDEDRRDLAHLQMVLELPDGAVTKIRE